MMRSVTKALLPAVLVLLPCALHAQKPGRTPNTLALDSTQARAAATVADLAWLAGHWRGPGLGGVAEEIWSAPDAGTMVGVFRLIRDGAVVFYEIMTLQPDDNSVALVLKHFNADLTGWEEKDQVVRFPLVALADDVAFFDGLTIRRLGADRLLLQLAIGRRDGPAREEEFHYTRVPHD